MILSQAGGIGFDRNGFSLLRGCGSDGQQEACQADGEKTPQMEGMPHRANSLDEQARASFAAASRNLLPARDLFQRGASNFCVFLMQDTCLDGTTSDSET